jgi:hypothetical protein
MIFIKRMKKLIKKILRESKDEFDWIRNTVLSFDVNNPPKVGDVLVCLPGYQATSTKHTEIDDPDCAGGGYAEGRVIVVGEIESYPDHPIEKSLIIWPDEDKSTMYWDYEDICFACGIYGGYLTYYIGEELNESKDEFDWIREVPTGVPFEQAVIGRKYRIETTEVFKGALEACDEYEWLYDSTKVEVIGFGIKEYDDIFCDSERKDKVFSLKLRFYHPYSPDSQSGSFWVTEDMVTLYEIV